MLPLSDMITWRVLVVCLPRLIIADSMTDVLTNIDEMIASTKDCVSDMLSQSSSDLKARFSTEQLALFCTKQQRWTQASSPEPGMVQDAVQPLTNNQLSWLFGIHTCRSLKSCFCIGQTGQLCDQIDSAVNTTLEKAATLSELWTKDARLALPMLRDDPVIELGTDNRTAVKSTAADEVHRESKRQISLTAFATPALRKEYRRLTDEERQRFHDALNYLKTDMIDGKSKYDILVLHHTPAESPGAHWGPAFLPWHRELLKQVEVAIRLNDPRAAVPYWDSTLDESLPTPADSIIWTDEFLGPGKGFVTSGPFADWVTVHKANNEFKIARDVGASKFGSLYNPQDLKSIMNKTLYEQLTNCVDPYFELLHGAIHVWVGGHMADLPISPNDPSFFLHHAFVDYVWERFRQKQKTSSRSVDYPSPDMSCNVHHYADAPMLPFPNIKNMDGLSDTYTSEFYSYEAAPSCDWLKQDCGSPYLFCDTSNSRCLSKVRRGGNCTGYDSARVNICYDSVCIGGRCVAAPSPAASSPSITPSFTPTSSTSQATVPDILTSFSTSGAASTEGPTTTMTKQRALTESSGQLLMTTAFVNASPLSTTVSLPSVAPTSTPPTATPASSTTERWATAFRDETVHLDNGCSCYCRCPEEVFVAKKNQTQPDRSEENQQTRATSSSVAAFTDATPNNETNMTENINQTLRSFSSHLAATNSSIWQAEDASDTSSSSSTPETVWLPITILRSDLSSQVKQLVSNVSVVAVGQDYSAVYQGKVFEGVNASTGYPYYAGASAVQVRSPVWNQGHTETQILVRDERAERCEPHCYQPSIGYVPCSGKVVLDIDPAKSDPVAYTPFESQVMYLSWQGRTRSYNNYLFLCPAATDNVAKRPVKQPCQYLKFPGFMLIGLADTVLENSTLEDCKQSCQNTALSNDEGSKQTSTSFECKSAMYWYDTKECVLSSESRNTKPELFQYFKEDMIYLELICDDKFMCDAFGLGG